MKQLYIYFLAFLLLFFSIKEHASAQRVDYDSLRISLLTCSPHDEIYSLYGHTALRIENLQSGEDFVVNYGLFSFEKPFFILRFVFGLTDYEMGFIPLNYFMEEYSYWGSSITQQVLNLTKVEKERFMLALNENYRPENRVYRYNFFYNNCTTKARNIIVESLDGRVEYNDTVPDQLTFRKMLHEKTAEHPWAALGNDLLLGIGADKVVSLEEKQFLPEDMLLSADSAYVLQNDGTRRKLVSEKRIILPARHISTESSSFPSPVIISSAILLLSVLFSFVEWKKRKYFWGYDILLFLLFGLCGIILTAMIFSAHPTVSQNAQILLFNPLLLIFGIKAVLRFKKGEMHWLWLVEILLLCLLLVVYSFEIQWLDPSVRLLTLSMLLRCAMKIYLSSKKAEVAKA